MRNEEDWLLRVRPLYVMEFPPRIQQVLKSKITEKEIVTPIESTFITGEVNFGKTVLAAQMMLQEQKNIYLQGGPKDATELCCFISVPNLFEEIKSTFNPEAAVSTQDVLNKYCNMKLLILDEFGTLKPTDWVLQTLYLIINHRYDYLKTTILTSNHSLPDIAKILGDDRITSRIDRMCKVIHKSDWRKVA
jgi:DNA replication protein DnaC